MTTPQLCLQLHLADDQGQSPGRTDHRARAWLQGLPNGGVVACQGSRYVIAIYRNLDYTGRDLGTEVQARRLPLTPAMPRKRKEVAVESPLEAGILCVLGGASGRGGVFWHSDTENRHAVALLGRHGVETGEWADPRTGEALDCPPPAFL